MMIGIDLFTVIIVVIIANAGLLFGDHGTHGQSRLETAFPTPTVVIGDMRAGSSIGRHLA